MDAHLDRIFSYLDDIDAAQREYDERIIAEMEAAFLDMDEAMTAPPVLLMLGDDTIVIEPALGVI